MPITYWLSLLAIRFDQIIIIEITFSPDECHAELRSTHIVRQQLQGNALQLLDPNGQSLLLWIGAVYNDGSGFLLTCP